ncbi:endolytic transglycosylase MltG [Candidatus Dojkabacteria bacterium]|nr:endolytic transglycosylase MltG [Candidatus Dojkabacteria bacterium]
MCKLGKVVNLNTTTKVPSHQNSATTRANKKSGCGKILSKLIILLIFILLFGAGITVSGGIYYKKALTSENSDSSQKVEFIVSQGESVTSITDRLIESDLLDINFKIPFLVYVRVNNLAPKIQAGTFEIPKNLTLEELVQTLQHGGLDEAWTTIPEGLRKDEIAEIIAYDFELNGISFDTAEFLDLTTDKDFISTLELGIETDDLEGFLFPDKYLIPTDSTPKDVIEILVNNFKARTENLDLTYKDLIIASMLEREGYTETDRKMISDILQRRLEEGWALNVDATLLYYHKDWKHFITNADKEINHPYNTYRLAGLTPTPICNPGLVAIDAALNPTPNNYYFYIHGKDRQAHYAETLEEHNQNIQKYLK